MKNFPKFSRKKFNKIKYSKSNWKKKNKIRFYRIISKRITKSSIEIKKEMTLFLFLIHITCTHTHTILLDIFFFFEAEKTEVVHDPFVSPIDPEADLWNHLTGFRELDEVFAFLTRDRRDKDRLGKRRHG